MTQFSGTCKLCNASISSGISQESWIDSLESHFHSCPKADKHFARSFTFIKPTFSMASVEKIGKYLGDALPKEFAKIREETIAECVAVSESTCSGHIADFCYCADRISELT